MCVTIHLENQGGLIKQSSLSFAAAHHRVMSNWTAASAPSPPTVHQLSCTARGGGAYRFRAGQLRSPVHEADLLWAERPRSLRVERPPQFLRCHRNEKGRAVSNGAPGSFRGPPRARAGRQERWEPEPAGRRAPRRLIGGPRCTPATATPARAAGRDGSRPAPQHATVATDPAQRQGAASAGAGNNAPGTGNRGGSASACPGAGRCASRWAPAWRWVGCGWWWGGGGVVGGARRRVRRRIEGTPPGRRRLLGAGRSPGVGRVWERA